MGWWLRWLGALMGALSVFSLVRQHWDFALAPLVAQLLEFYRSLLHPPAELISWLVALIVPISLPADVVIVWLLIGGALERSSRPKPSIRFDLAEEIIGFVLTFVFWPIALVLTFPGWFGPRRIQLSEQVVEDWSAYHGIRAWLTEMRNMVLAFLALFALNAGLA